MGVPLQRKKWGLKISVRGLTWIVKKSLWDRASRGRLEESSKQVGGRLCVCGEADHVQKPMVGNGTTEEINQLLMGTPTTPSSGYGG